MTISSFTSVSLPEGEGKEPIISFNIKSPSITLDALSTSRWFLIHVLEATAEGARLAGGFTHGGGGREWFDGAALRELEPESEGKIPGRGIRVVEEVIGKHPVMEADIVLPRLEGRGVKMVLKCEVASGYRVQPKDQGFIKVGDHVVCLGVVKEVYGGMEGGQEEALGYAEGVYRGVGEAIDVEGG
jgi:flavin reductase (DIM6/NTAB) family NADH-FMN oxidoreductase RutF